MQNSNHANNADQRAELANGHDVERQLALSEQRYAIARDACDKARAELRELSSRDGVSPHLVKSARARLESIAARCTRLRARIDELEDRLD